MIDIIIPAYNAHKYLRDALESIENQSIKDKFVITIVDDASKSNYNSIVNDFKDKLNINLIRLKFNHGPGYARQVGINKTHNKYLFFLDADDVLVGNKAIEKLYNIIDSNENIKLVIGKELSNYKSNFHDYHMYSKLMLRDVIDKYKLKVPNYKREEDIAFALSYMSMIEKKEICYVDSVIYKYRHINENSICAKYTLNYELNYSFKAIDYAYKYVTKYSKYNLFKNHVFKAFLEFSEYYFQKEFDTKTRELYMNNCYKFYIKYKIYIDILEKEGDMIFEEKKFNNILWFINALKNL